MGDGVDGFGVGVGVVVKSGRLLIRVLVLLLLCLFFFNIFNILCVCFMIEGGRFVSCVICML